MKKVTFFGNFYFLIINSVPPPKDVTITEVGPWIEVPDNESNILMTTDRNNNKIVKAATMDKLIERLTTEKDHGKDICSML
jgi:hypothetical protein